MASEDGYFDRDGTFVVAPGSGLAVAAAASCWVCDQVPPWRAVTASARAWAWLAVGIRCGATTMLRCLPVCKFSARLCARNSWTASVDAEAFVRSSWNAVDSRVSATTAVVPPPMGRAAEGVYDRSPVSSRLSLRAITLSAPAEVATFTIDGSTAPSTGQAKSVLGVTWSTVSTVVAATSVAALSWLSEPVTPVPLWAREARSGSAKGSATTSLPWTACCSSSSHCLATAWWVPAMVVLPLPLRTS
ncbi:hypothetical protein SAURM35S_03962 [Streptomyces aurantiogriseus]